MISEYGSLDKIRQKIDGIDKEIIRLLAERSVYVFQAAEFKKNSEEVKAPDRVKIVMEKVREESLEYGLNPEIAEKIYRTIIDCFIRQETMNIKGIN